MSDNYATIIAASEQELYDYYSQSYLISREDFSVVYDYCVKMASVGCGFHMDTILSLCKPDYKVPRLEAFSVENQLRERIRNKDIKYTRTG